MRKAKQYMEKLKISDRNLSLQSFFFLKSVIGQSNKKQKNKKEKSGRISIERANKIVTKRLNEIFGDTNHTSSVRKACLLRPSKAVKADSSTRER